MVSPLVLLLSLCLVCCKSAAVADLMSEFDHNAVLDPQGRMKLYWSTDLDAKMVYFAVEAVSTGWIGLGFSENGAIIGSDVVIGWVKDGKGNLKDYFVTSSSSLVVDHRQDYELTGYKVSGGKTVLRFQRKFDTHDPWDRKFEKGDTNEIFAFHSENPESPMEIPKHVFKVSRRLISFVKRNKRAADNGESGEKTFRLTARNVTIPSRKSTYWCTISRGPNLKSKHHITRFEAKIQSENKDLVHHIALFECDTDYNFTSEFSLQGGDCFANNMFAKCGRFNPIAVAGAGIETHINLPDHVGFPIGGEDLPKIYMLEIFYSNPEKKEGKIDSSGFDLYYTQNVRKYDGGMVYLGTRLDDWQIIPPKQKDWVLVGYCMHQCTEHKFNSTSLPERGIKIFAASTHMHSAGRAAWTKHVRNGKELPEIDCTDKFDFQNERNLRLLKEEAHIKPGDDLVQFCKYDSSNSNKLIKGGFDGDDEMCYGIMFYYPRIPGFLRCQSVSIDPSLKLLNKYFDKPKVTSLNSNSLVHHNTTWSDAMVADFREYERDNEKVIPECIYKANLTAYDLNNITINVPIPKISEGVPPEQHTCQSQVISSESVNLSRSACAFVFGTLCALVGALQ
ncbi:DBH-like monooxygenase protein 1 homolog [Stylophora pistillata]|uniref:DBH-like monooxygenase protein 1 homolog n=1 Tax=Stylophora pistillata TaxID=50429 RepID=UPI000C03BB64|nr:DBH-like monooxygenase protein 1 homolog [Stylophora pistillata]XP_022798628.1 DBH-like monooxygenase protein 1 homolog [Stylophora pistillata]XP_022798636.1 DBH-like monooxygenase protein 1 homolog [Stylophora pistillata]